MTAKKVVATEPEEIPLVGNDIDGLAPESDLVTLSSGTEVRIERLKTRQLFKLLKILTRGAGPLLGNLTLSPDAGEGEFVGQLIALVVISIPEAEDEAIEFIQEMVSSPYAIEHPKSKADRERNDELKSAINEELANPEIDDTITIIEAVVRKEAKDIQSLGKRLSALVSATRA